MGELLVIGGSAGIGLATVERALDDGRAVRAFSRSAETMKLSHQRLERWAGNAANPADVARAMVGVEAVVLALGARLTADTVLRSVDLFSKATETVIAAMKVAGAERLIAVTGFGAGESAAKLSSVETVPFRAALGRIYDDKGRQEDAIKASGLNWTIVRPGLLTNGPATGRYQVLVEPERWRNGTISRANVAHFICSAIDDEALVGEAPVIVV